MTVTMEDTRRRAQYIFGGYPEQFIEYVNTHQLPEADVVSIKGTDTELQIIKEFLEGTTLHKLLKVLP